MGERLLGYNAAAEPDGRMGSPPAGRTQPPSSRALVLAERDNGGSVIPTLCAP